MSLSIRSCHSSFQPVQKVFDKLYVNGLWQLHDWGRKFVCIVVLITAMCTHTNFKTTKNLGVHWNRNRTRQTFFLHLYLFNEITLFDQLLNDFCSIKYHMEIVGTSHHRGILRQILWLHIHTIVLIMADIWLTRFRQLFSACNVRLIVSVYSGIQWRTSVTLGLTHIYYFVNGYIDSMGSVSLSPICL